MQTDVLKQSRLLAVQTRDGLEFRPSDEVALAMNEFEGRLTIVFADGSVAHRPGPLQAIDGLVPITEGVAGNPQKARLRKGVMEFPGGWSFKAVKSTPSKKPQPPVSSGLPAGKARIESIRLRALRKVGSKYALTLDDGSTLSLTPFAASRLTDQLGIKPDELEPCNDRHRAMYRRGLRDFPCVLLNASAAELKGFFGRDEAACIANLLWEAARHRAMGQPLDYGTEFRGFYYRPILAVLERLGLLHEKSTRLTASLPTDVLLNYLEDRVVGVLASFQDPHYALYQRIISELIGEDRLITLRDLGFIPTRPDLRQLGTVRPEWLLVTEKSSLAHEAREISRIFGVSLIILGGMPKWEATEPLCDMLRTALSGKTVKVVTYGDYDPAGWAVDDGTVKQMARYGIPAEIVGRLILPKRFTKKEIALFAEPIPANSFLNRHWLERTNGIDGKPLLMHADHLRPLERVIAAFKEETGLAELTP